MFSQPGIHLIRHRVLSIQNQHIFFRKDFRSQFFRRPGIHHIQHIIRRFLTGFRQSKCTVIHYFPGQIRREETFHIRGDFPGHFRSQSGKITASFNEDLCRIFRGGICLSQSGSLILHSGSRIHSHHRTGSGNGIGNQVFFFFVGRIFIRSIGTFSGIVHDIHDFRCSSTVEQYAFFQFEDLVFHFFLLRHNSYSDFLCLFYVIFTFFLQTHLPERELEQLLFFRESLYNRTHRKFLYMVFTPSFCVLFIFSTFIFSDVFKALR